MIWRRFEYQKKRNRLDDVVNGQSIILFWIIMYEKISVSFIGVGVCCCSCACKIITNRNYQNRSKGSNWAVIFSSIKANEYISRKIISYIFKSFWEIEINVRSIITITWVPKRCFRCSKFKGVSTCLSSNKISTAPACTCKCKCLDSPYYKRSERQTEC
jgi:hypothetical protein